MKYLDKNLHKEKEKFPWDGSSALGKRATSLGSNVLFLEEGPNALGRRVDSSWSNVLAWGKAQVSWGNNLV
jgi:hypothetical protein